ncbi:MAG TPA: Holliday junction branch migration DNA helicase RuvB [Patescibacteria group bacterium]
MTDQDNNRIIAPSARTDDLMLDNQLRPHRLADFIGQEAIKENLKIFIEAARQRGEPIDHVLLYGGPGLGKTTLSHIIAREMNVNIKITAGPAIERAGDLAAILTNLQEGDILFIDELHRLNKTIEEILYPAMEDYALDIIIGKGPSARTLRLELPKFTLVGATTRLSLISSPLRDRFGNVLHLNFYQDDHIEKIINRSARIIDVKIDQPAADELARRSRKTPRVANRLLKRVRDYAQVRADGLINLDIAREALAMLQIDHSGLDQTDQKIIETIVSKFNGGPVGLNTIAAYIGEETATIEDVYEPFLIQLGMIDRTARGRVATKTAYDHLGVKPTLL